MPSTVTPGRPSAITDGYVPRSGQAMREQTARGGYRHLALDLCSVVEYRPRMAKIVIKKLPPGPRPTRDQLDLRGHSELSWPAAVKLASKSSGNVLFAQLSVDYWSDTDQVRTTLRRPDLLDVKGALVQARKLVVTGAAREASVEGRASYSYPGARPVLWDLGGYKRVEYWEVVEALAGMPTGHDYAGDGTASGAFMRDLAAQVGISAADCYLLLREAEALQLVRSRDLGLAGSPAAKRANLRWYAVRYWKMELARIERAAALNTAAKSEAGQ